MKKWISVYLFIIIFTVSVVIFDLFQTYRNLSANKSATEEIKEEAPAYVVINDNIPTITVDDAYGSDGTIQPFEHYSDLDALGRAGEAYVCISKDSMPDYERESISMIKPSGWHLYNTKQLWNITLEDEDSFYLYNRCHIIGFQLTGIDGTHRSELLSRNLFTGTRQLNIGAMLDCENQVASYLRTHPGCYVLYKATPEYEGVNLLATGIHLQALSLDGELQFNVYVFNIQKGFSINYLTGLASYIGH